MESIFFYTFAGIAVVSATGVIAVRNPVHSAVCLIICLLQVAAVYILLRSPFLAVVQVFIYVGAVMVLFLFAVMMLDIGKEKMERHVHKQRKIAIPIAIVLFGMMSAMVLGGGLATQQGQYDASALDSNTEVIGKLLYTKYIFPFEVVSVLLLVALIGAIVLVMHRKGEPAETKGSAG